MVSNHFWLMVSNHPIIFFQPKMASNPLPLDRLVKLPARDVDAVVLWCWEAAVAKLAVERKVAAWLLFRHKISNVYIYILYVYLTII